MCYGGNIYSLVLLKHCLNIFGYSFLLAMDQSNKLLCQVFLQAFTLCIGRNIE